jgi:hypothetical protein
MPTPEEETRREVEAALAARRELGMEYEEAIAAGLLDRVNQLALMRAGDLRREAERADESARVEKESRTQRFVLASSRSARASRSPRSPATWSSRTSRGPGLLGRHRRGQHRRDDGSPAAPTGAVNRRQTPRDAPPA